MSRHAPTRPTSRSSARSARFAFFKARRVKSRVNADANHATSKNATERTVAANRIQDPPRQSRTPRIAANSANEGPRLQSCTARRRLSVCTVAALGYPSRGYKDVEETDTDEEP